MSLDTPSPAPRKSPIGPTIARILMGLSFTFFGTFGLLMAMHVIPPPTAPMPEGAAAFNLALAKTGYMFPLNSGTQLMVGLLLLFNRYVPLALTLIAPVIVNIILFHLFLQPAGIVPGVVVTALELYLAWSYRENFRAVLAARSVPV